MVLDHYQLKSVFLTLAKNTDLTNTLTKVVLNFKNLSELEMGITMGSEKSNVITRHCDLLFKLMTH
jgi:hypothetical protein